MKWTSFMSKANTFLIRYLLLLIDNILKVASFIWKTLSSQNCEKLGATVFLYRVTILSRIARFSSCTVYWRILVTHSIKCPDRKKSGTVQAMGYPIHENALCRSLTRYILHRSIVSEQVLKWHDIISFSVCRLCPMLPLVGQKCVSKCVSQLCVTFYKLSEIPFVNFAALVNKATC
jgi:hypothetical protein